MAEPNTSPDNDRTRVKKEDIYKKKVSVVDPEKDQKVIEEDAQLEGLSETEIATAAISLPAEGGWGWVVVAASFMCTFILQGILFTFGSIYNDMSQDLNLDVSLVTMVNSLAIALNSIAGPIVSALINRYGFRLCGLVGSIIVSLSYLVAYFTTHFIMLLVFYGILPGIGGCLINMTSQLIVGFYFERLRGIAVAIAGMGHNIGITVMSRVNTYVVNTAGWRTTTLIHSGMFGMVYFLSLAYRPILSITVAHVEKDRCTVTYLPSLTPKSFMSMGDKATTDVPEPSKTERMFNTVSNMHFPTAAELLRESRNDGVDRDDEEAGPSSENKSQFKLSTTKGLRAVSERQLQLVKTFISSDEIIEEKIEVQTFLPKKRRWCPRCFFWERETVHARPMYRDDAFYSGRVQHLSIYKEMDTASKKTGLEYQMAVSRALTADDLKENKGINTTAVKRVLVTMLDPVLLYRRSFVLVCFTGFFTHIGLLMPFIFLPDRNREKGVDEKHCNLFVSVMGFSGAVGRIAAGILACKTNPVRLYIMSCFLAGAGTLFSSFSFNIYYQYTCCVMFGVATAVISTLRSLVIVDLYGLESLTNATGLLLMFQGFGSLLSSPLSSLLKKYFGYFTSFTVAGVFEVLGGLLIVNVKQIAVNEEEEKAAISRKSSFIRTKKREPKPETTPQPEPARKEKFPGSPIPSLRGY